MRSVESYLYDYSLSHRNRVNQAIHIACVPLIYFSSMGLGWAVPIGHWLGLVLALPLPWQPWINVATLSLLPQLVFYARLSPGSALTGLAWMSLSIAGILAIRAAGLSLVWICGLVWVLAWVAQFYGHRVEGAKPSFADDLLFLFIGPLFVTAKLRGAHFGAPARAEA